MNTTSPPGSVTPSVYSRDDHSISRRNIDEDALKIMYRLIRHGHKAYLVGGGVRDLLLGKTPKDFDIATDATPKKIKELFGNSRIIGRRFKLVHIFFRSGKIIQVSTFRDFSEDEIFENAESDKPLLNHDNKYGNEVTDAQRRDLTINGLFYDLATFSIIDYVGGMGDLREGIIRVIGDPQLRFIQDPVRIIRVVRHAARSGFIIDQACEQAIEKHRNLILKCPSMRIFEEIKKDLLSGSALEIFRHLYRYNLLDLMIPGLCMHQGAMFADGAACANCFAAMDRYCRENSEANVQAILSILATFSGEQSPTTRTIPRFQSEDQVQPHIQEAFAKIAVPRRDRETIALVLKLWRRLETDPAKVKAETLSRSSVLAVLKIFAELLDYDTTLEKQRSIIDEACYLGDSGSGNGHYADRGPRHRGRRRRNRTKMING